MNKDYILLSVVTQLVTLKMQAESKQYDVSFLPGKIQSLVDFIIDNSK